MARFVLAAIAIFMLALSAEVAPAAVGQRDIDAAIEKGAAYLKGRYKAGANPEGVNHGIGPAALVGIALIEAKVPANDAAMTSIATAVRTASYIETQTYQLSLCLLFLDKLEDAKDVPLIQMLAARILAGQSAQGGWTYGCVDKPTAEQEQWLRTKIKADPLAPAPMPNDPAKAPVEKLHPDVKEYAAAMAANRKQDPGRVDDNSNTQFAILAIWAARKHGVPVEAALNVIEKRFLASQHQAGGWGYSGDIPSNEPSMTCAGLLGLSTGLARRDDRKGKVESPKEIAPKTPKGGDPFFSPSPKAEEKKPADKRPEFQSPAVQRGLACLGVQFVNKIRGVGDLIGGANAGGRDLYMLWSVERVGVIFNIDKIGGIDWYDYSSDMLVKTQAADGSWLGQYGAEVSTAFALLILLKANLARDLSSKFRDGKDSELRAGASGGTPAGGTPSSAPMPKQPGTGIVGTKPLPTPVEDESTKLAASLVLTSPADWTKALEKVRDAKGGDYTKGLVIAIHRLDGDRKKEARDALAERLTRMSAETLKGMTASDDAELRRGAVLACAMKDDKVHVPDLIDRLTDDDDLVVRAAKAGLKSLTAQDFGPKPGATKEECKSAAAAWRAWWAKQK